MVIKKTRAVDVGPCQECGAGKRGPVSMYEIEPRHATDTQRGLRLCLNCLKALRLSIGDALLLPPAE